MLALALERQIGVERIDRVRLGGARVGNRIGKDTAQTRIKHLVQR